MSVAPDPRTDGGLRRICDILVSAIALLVCLPLFALIAVAIKLDSRGPVFFSQPRVGRGRVLFPILKFRTMVRDADRRGPQVAGKQDARITRVGAVWRATKLDEFPQFWNVLRGEMTLIGSRAEVPEMIRHYTSEELQILEFKPGLTGPGQIYFTTDQAAELDGVADGEAHYVTHQLHRKLALDLDYLRNRGLRADLSLIWTTIKLVLHLR